MKRRFVIVEIKKEYVGSKLISRWKTTTTSWRENGRNITYCKQDKNNFHMFYFSDADIRKSL